MRGTDLGPCTRFEFLLLDGVVGDGGTAVVIWRGPVQGERVSGELVSAEVLRRARPVQDADVDGRGVEAGRIAQLKPVLAGVVALRVLHHQAGVVVGQLKHNKRGQRMFLKKVDVLGKWTKITQI